MSLTTEEVKKIAYLARLAIDETSLSKYVRELCNILDLATQMATTDTTHIAPMAHPYSVMQRLRLDKVTEPNQRELLQSIAPHVIAGLYIVPQVIE